MITHGICLNSKPYLVFEANFKFLGILYRRAKCVIT
jgi:hypothetical protein